MQKICIVIPCYNEVLRLDRTLLQSYVVSNPSVCICLVNDGSSDGTLQLLNEIKNTSPDTVLVIDCVKNGGKAEAVRKGMFEAYNWKDFECFAYFDADFATPLDETNNMFSVFKSRSVEFVLGSRVKRLGAEINRNPYRHILGRVFSTFAGWVLGLPVYDTQCGAKLISRTWLMPAFEEPFISSWLFDVEILARLRNIVGRTELLKHTVELPLSTWIEKGGSKIKFIHLLKIPLELLKIHRAYN